ncbi:universal stress protein [Palleronia sediminis]|uniref:Universal stress protein n=1 Tax=Palleronia sediminis TaxID=2547833 RepID=A0A4R6A7D1_9RHOB|nr:universal stress protein [Palleronia sediminis]TDL79661.1 universal stress protein [Palleronia sediminis]
MSGFKTIATALTPRGGIETLETAIAWAEAWDAHLEPFCLADMQANMPPMMTPDLVFAAPLPEPTGDEEIAALEMAARDRLKDSSVDWEIPPRGEPLADFGPRLARRLRFADLVVLAGGGADDQGRRETIFEAALYHSRVPILMAPPGAAAGCAHVAVAWDGSDTALAGLRAAMPALKRAERVEVLSIGDEVADGPALLRMLARHDIEAEHVMLPAGGGRVSEALAGGAQDRGADLLVMGAYGHARLRQAILGGVTRDLVRAAPMPLLMAR